MLNIIQTFIFFQLRKPVEEIPDSREALASSAMVGRVKLAGAEAIPARRQVMYMVLAVRQAQLKVHEVAEIWGQPAASAHLVKTAQWLI
jgi:hypothetical protein